MKKCLVFALLAVAAMLAGPAKADTFNYTLTDFDKSWTWTLTGIPHTLPILPQFSTQVGQPGDIFVSFNGGTAQPNVMSLTATTLLFQCDPTLLCGWDTAAEMEFESTTPLLNGTELLTGNFVGRNVFFWGSGLRLTVSKTDDPETVPESSSGLLVMCGLALLAGVIQVSKRLLPAVHIPTQN